MAMTITITRDTRDAEYRRAHRKAVLYGRLNELTKRNAKLEQLNDSIADKEAFWIRKCLRIVDSWCNDLEKNLPE